MQRDAGADQGALVPGGQRGARRIRRKEQVLRAYAAQYTVMENANALAAKAIRTCGGQAMLKTPAAGAHLSRQPLRLADAALDRRNLHRPPRPRDAVRGRARRMSDLSSLACHRTSPRRSGRERIDRRSHRPQRGVHARQDRDSLSKAATLEPMPRFTTRIERRRRAR